MNLLNELQVLTYPWNLTDSFKFKSFLYNTSLELDTEFLHMFKIIMSINVELKPKFESEFTPEIFMEYPGFLWSELESRIPTYQDISDSTIQDVLNEQGIEEKNERMLEWAKYNWIKKTINSKQSIVIDYVINFIRKKQDMNIKSKVVNLVNNYIDLDEDLHSFYKLLISEDYGKY